jgi:tetratricopeptide (TPR) repeat protein
LVKIIYIKNELDLVLLYEQNALEKLPHTEYRELSNTYGIIGNIYMNKSNYDLAKEYYEKTLDYFIKAHDIFIKCLPRNHPRLKIKSKKFVF